MFESNTIHCSVTACIGRWGAHVSRLNAFCGWFMTWIAPALEIVDGTFCRTACLLIWSLRPPVLHLLIGSMLCAVAFLTGAVPL